MVTYTHRETCNDCSKSETFTGPGWQDIQPALAEWEYAHEQDDHEGEEASGHSGDPNPMYQQGSGGREDQG